MGYYVQLTDAHFLIPENWHVLQILKQLNHNPNLPKYGFRSKGGKRVETWFCWMPSNYDETVRSVQEVFELLGFDTDPERDFVALTGYDNKTGQEDLFIEAVAPFVADGSFLEWRGEDGEIWRHTVRKGVVTVLHPESVWG